MAKASEIETSALKSAISRVKACVQREREPGPFGCYLLRDGMIHATDRAKFAAAPFPWDGDPVLVPAVELETVIGRMPKTVKLSFKGSKLTVSSGRFRGAIETLPTDAAFEVLKPEGDERGVPEELWRALPAIREFVGDQDSPAWLGCVIGVAGKIAAVSEGNKALAVADADMGDVLVPRQFADVVLSGDEPPASMLVSEGSMSFTWLDGTWARSQLVSGEPAAALVKMIEAAFGADQSQEITDEWRESVGRVVAMGDREVELHADVVRSGFGSAEVEDAAETPTPKGAPCSKWPREVLGLVLKHADGWSPDVYPSPVPWNGPVLRGLVMGRK